jgi:transcriptional regulator NrdR family protein
LLNLAHHARAIPLLARFIVIDQINQIDGQTVVDGAAVRRRRCCHKATVHRINTYLINDQLLEVLRTS